MLRACTFKGYQLTGVLLLDGEKLLNLVTNFSVRNLDIILSLSVFSHQGKESIVRDIKLLID
jgi:hypothetical protein